jgi:hypothetical protein
MSRLILTDHPAGHLAKPHLRCHMIGDDNESDLVSAA